MTDEKSRPIEWPLAAIWITIFLCITAVVLTLILVP